MTSVHVSLVGLQFFAGFFLWTAVFLQVSFFGLLFCAGVLWTTVLSAVSCWTADIYV